MAGPGDRGRVTRNSTRPAHPATSWLSRRHQIELSQSISPPSIPNIDDKGSATPDLTSCLTRRSRPAAKPASTQLERSHAGTKVEADLASPQTQSDRVGPVPRPELVQAMTHMTLNS